MHLEDILNAQPNLSFHHSRQLVIEIMMRRDWRCYSSKTTKDIDRLVDRYLKHHVRMPGIVNDEIHATVPVNVFFWQDPATGAQNKGGLFTNGAVVVSDHQNIRSKSLFIRDTHAKMWLYPGEDEYVIMGNEMRKELHKEQ